MIISIKNLLFIFLLFIFLFLYHGLAGASHKILAIQSINVKPYTQALDGFKTTCNCQVNKLLVSELNDPDFAKKVHEINPDLILTIGRDALLRVKGIKDKPIIFMLALNPQSILSSEKNITGIRMNIPLEKQLDVFAKALPEKKKIGLLFDPTKTHLFIKRARAAAAKNGLDLFVKEVRSPKEVPSFITEMKGKIDAFWMLPDITVICPETVEFILLFSIENKIPIFSFSEKYVEMGALMSLSINPVDLGKQAGQIAEKILAGNYVMNIYGVEPEDIVISINVKVAKKFEINIHDEILHNAKIIK